MEQRFLFTAVTLDHLANMRQYIEEAGQALGADSELIADLMVAANEATTNTILHGYDQTIGDIEISVSHSDGTASVTIIDSAPPFNPTAVDAPDLSVPPMQRKPGGLGILMIQEFVDTIDYERTADGKNKLILTKGDAHGVSS